MAINIYMLKMNIININDMIKDYFNNQRKYSYLIDLVRFLDGIAFAYLNCDIKRALYLQNECEQQFYSLSFEVVKWLPNDETVKYELSYIDPQTKNPIKIVYDYKQKDSLQIIDL